jgi:hypothetical protein
MVTLRIYSNSGGKAAEEPYVSDYGDILDTFLSSVRVEPSVRWPVPEARICDLRMKVCTSRQALGVMTVTVSQRDSSSYLLDHF